MSVGPETPNELMVVFSNTISAGFDALQGAVNGVFGLLIVLVVALTGIQWALSSNREVLASGFGKVLLIGAFAWLINDWQQLSETIYAGFIELGLTAGGGSLSRADFLNPGAILAQGWEIVKALGETPAPVDNPLDVVGNMSDALILGLAMIGIMLAFAVLALQIIVALLEFKIVTLGGFVLLPFGIWNKSAFLAERPLGYVVSSGLKVLALALVISGARTIFDQLQPSANPDIYEALSILVAAILLAMLALFIPNLAAALVTGGPALGAGSAVTGALAVGGAGALAGAGIAGAGSAAAGAAARMAAPAKAAAGANSGRPPSPPSSMPSSPSPSRPSSPSPSPPPSSGRAPGASKPSSGPAGPSSPLSGSAAGGSPEPVSGAAAGASSAARQTATGPAAARPPRPAGRSAALQAFFVANAGRSLLPSGESSGVLSPNLKTEES
ncbi:MAG: P-type conjugative transfer protein TrbL [Brevundimonas sp.]|uniref:P-type conjugative transfer protein TrbL n=1 Tax=Brevundimonas sp. TaxID=1871086 RepID=UPI002487E45B|nr:P-type conjugative transfer protein TrbL [Brevundimonas sp.]MDI1325624.1 P-type conjugative transfer protein TrbL [Brevundimonas sp.]